MDRTFDLVALLKQRSVTKTHKVRPSQFVSVAGGIQKRLETNIKHRKSSRLSVFDRIRNISKCQSPCRPVLTEAQQKAEHRKQQLEKWKEEKEKKKKEAAAQKKKPFVAGVAHKATFGPPPPPKSIPSTSGRVTRSQALKQRNEQAKQTQSFAPYNASFKPPQFAASQMPSLVPISKKKTSKPNFTFEPVPPKAKVESTRATRSRNATTKPTTADTKTTSRQNYKTKPQSNIVSKPSLLKQIKFQSSSSSSDIEQPIKKSLQTKTSNYQSSSSSDTYIKKPLLSEKSSTFQSSSSSDIDTLSKNSICQSSSSSDLDQQVSKTQDTTSISQESTSGQEIGETIDTLKNCVPKSESPKEEKLRTLKYADLSLTPEQIIEEAKNISPHVTLSRGKSNARKEMKKKLDEGLLDEDNSDMESVKHFRRQLDSEISRMSSVCEAWDKIFGQTLLPEPVQELVLAAVGQARLLMSQKMQQFASLVEACAAPAPAPGAALVTPADLHGFWDMLFMQVENVDMRFKKLEELRAREWVVEEQTAPAAKKPARPVAAKKVKPAGGPSRLRDMIAAARKAKKDQESQSEQSGSDKSGASSPECKTFEAGFFSVSSPVRRPAAPATPANKSSLLKSVLSSEALKASASKSSTSFAMLRASLMSKNVDIEGVSPLMQTPKLAPVNLFATPSRSILKQVNPVSTKKSETSKTVLFHESDEEPGSSPLSFKSCREKDAPAAEGGEELEPAEELAAEQLAIEGKENTPMSRRRSRMSRQNAVDRRSPVMTRSLRKSTHTPLAAAPADNGRPTPTAAAADHKRPARRTPAADDAGTPKRSTRSRKSAAVV